VAGISAPLARFGNGSLDADCWAVLVLLEEVEAVGVSDVVGVLGVVPVGAINA